MKKIITATAIAAAALFTPIGVGISAPSTVATAYAYTTDEQAYLLTLRAQSTIKGSDDHLLKLGRKVCELKGDGYSDVTLAQALVANGQAADLYDGGYIIGAATGALCPEVSA